MPKINVIAAAMLLWCGSALAADVKVIREIYTEVPAQYIYEIPVEKLAVYFLKSLNDVDKKLRVGNDNDKVTLYYDGKMVKSLYKPKDANDIEAWVELSAEIMDTASKKSPTAAQQDFELADVLMAGAIKHFDKDSKLYLNPEDNQGKRLKHQRNFAERKVDDNIYIKILAFNAYTKSGVEEAVKKYPEAKGLILDLRGSPGGMLSEGVAVADLFLDDAIIASTKGRKEAEEVYFNAEEVLAAALQEQDRAKVIGTNSLGKGSIQTLVSLSDGATIALTSAYFYTPSGSRLHGHGVLPDVCTFEMPEAKNIKNLLALPRNQFCPRESRADEGLDLDAAREMLATELNLGV